MKFTLIIPVYNTAKFLPDCIESCLNQDMQINKDYEIICINDGSTDNSTEVLSSYADRINIVNQENKGVGAARNKGLVEGGGEFVWFIDSDDYIEHNILGSLYRYLKESNADGVRIGVRRVSEDSHPYSPNQPFNISEGGEILQSSACNYLVSRSYLLGHKINFDPKIPFGEDTLWVFWINFFGGDFRCLANSVYYYRQRNGSAMNTKTLENARKHLKSMKAMADTYRSALNDNGDRLSVAQRTQIQHRIYWSVQNVLFDALKLPTDERHRIFDSLVAEKYYPYPILWERLSLKYGIKNLLVNVFTLMFPFRIYYRMVDWILRFYTSK